MVGAWINNDVLLTRPASYFQGFLNNYPSIKFGFGTASSSPTLWYPVNVIKSKIIDGWVRVEGDNFSVPNNLPPSSVLYLRVEPQQNGGNLNTLYIDDLRLHPFDANMKSYVYDLKTISSGQSWIIIIMPHCTAMTLRAIYFRSSERQRREY